MGQYLPIVVLAALAVLFVVISRVFSEMLNPKRPNEAKIAPYECGIVPGREPPERFPVKFYLVAMIFIIFDIEIIFLFPYATVHQGLGAFGLVAIILFSAVVFESLVYVVGNGAIDWGPIKRNRRREVVSPARTSRTTIRRVGLEGRLQGPQSDRPPAAGDSDAEGEAA